MFNRSYKTRISESPKDYRYSQTQLNGDKYLLNQTTTTK